MKAKTTFLKTVAIFVIVIISLSANAQLTVNGTLTPTQWVQNYLVGTGITVSNVTYTGAAQASGTFNGSASNIGFQSGVLLTSGSIQDAVGPNNQSSVTMNNNLNGDPDLDIIMSPYASHDASVLEFDFVPVSDTVKFRYVFGSDEYMVYAGGGINDGFGFFISGPGIAGPFSNNSTNIALIPGTTIPVTINNLNLNVNSQYYFDNGDGSGSGTAPDGLTIQYNGFTVPLTAISPVQCGQTYHIKIAIADGMDWILDSGVFLEAGSFSSQAVQILPEISYGGANDTTLYEGCGLACIYFVRTTNLANADTVNFSISGSATNGVDYNTGIAGSMLPSQLIFAPGQDSISYCINAVSDGIPEGMESIVLSINQTGPCLTTSTTVSLYIDEHQPLQMTVSDTTFSFCDLGVGAPVTLNANVTGGVEPYTYTWSGGAASVASPTVTVFGPTIFVVSVSDACTGLPDPTPSITDSIHVVAIPLNAAAVNITSAISYSGISSSTLYEGCGTACITFTRTATNTNADTLTLDIGGIAQNGVDYYYNNPGTPLPTQLIFPAGVNVVTYCINAVSDMITEGLESVTLSVFPANTCITSNNLTFSINDVAPLQLSVSNDTTFCISGASGTLTLNSTVSGGIAPYTYLWTNGAAPVANPSVTLGTSTTYMVTVNDACAATPTDPSLPVSNSVAVTVVPAINVNITPVISYGGVADTVLYRGCGTACVYFVRTSYLGVAATVQLNITGSAVNGTDYYYNTAGTAMPSQIVFPAGVDTVVYCVSGTVNSSVTALQNISISLVSPNICVTSNTASLYLGQHEPMTLTVSNDTTLCNPTSFTLNSSVTGGVEPYTYSWSNGAASVANPTVNISNTTTYVLTVTDACAGNPDPTPPVVDSTRITAILSNSLSVDAGNAITVCPGDPVGLNTLTTGGAAPLLYSWSIISGTDSLTTYSGPSTSLISTNAGGVYMVTVMDFCHYLRTDTVQVNVELSCVLTIPNVVSIGGGSAINEYFYVENLDKFPGSSLVIYNRWGKKIYETSSYLNDWSGSKYSDGTYYFILTVADGRSIPGFFQLVKK